MCRRHYLEALKHGADVDTIILPLIPKLEWKLPAGEFLAGPGMQLELRASIARIRGSSVQ